MADHTTIYLVLTSEDAGATWRCGTPSAHYIKLADAQLASTRIMSSNPRITTKIVSSDWRAEP